MQSKQVAVRGGKFDIEVLEGGQGSPLLYLHGETGVNEDAFLERFVHPQEIHVVPFSMRLYHAAVHAFERFGKGRGHPAKLNYGDCMAYAVAKHHEVPLLYKGEDFALTDIRPALA
jgi:ribonuclease VapC